MSMINPCPLTLTLSKSIRDFLTGNEYIGSDERDNIYSLFLDSRQGEINDEDIRILFHYWQTDLESPKQSFALSTRLPWGLGHEIQTQLGHGSRGYRNGHIPCRGLNAQCPPPS